MALAATSAGQAAGETPPPGRLALTLPGHGWSLVLEVPGYEMRPPKLSPDGSGVKTAGQNLDTGMVLSVFVEVAAGEGDARACRKHYWKRARRSPLQKVEIEKYERGIIALVEFLVPEHQGIEVEQKNVNAYLSKDGLWVDIHLSKAGYVPEDRELFEAILRTIRWEEHR